MNVETANADNGLPPQYRVLKGHERKARSGAQRVGPADSSEVAVVSIYLRQQSATSPLPAFESYAAMTLDRRERPSHGEMATRYGASPEDAAALESFAQELGLTIVFSNLSRRLIQVSGTLEQLSKAFAVDLGLYRSPEEDYRGYEGSVALPDNLADVVVGVFGLDNRRMALRAGASSPVPTSFTPPQIAGHYGFPENIAAGTTPVFLSDGASGQTIAILEFSIPGSTCGFAQSDIDTFIEKLNENTSDSPYRTTVVKTVTISGSAGNVPSGSATNLFPNGNRNDLEVTLDVEIAVSVAQGAKVVVYFAPSTEQGWADALSTIFADQENDPSVLSISWGYPELTAEGSFEWTQASVDVISSLFLQAGTRGMTVLVASGDSGATWGVKGGKAYVSYPASDPGVIACGGTALTVSSTGVWQEQTWPSTGGGISYLVPVPSWQSGVTLVPSANQDGHLGRGVPDVAGYATPGYYLWIYGQSTQTLTPPFTPIVPGAQSAPVGPVRGTSAVAPLYAALIALINAGLNTRVGYLNSLLYSLGGSHVFHDIADGISNAAIGSTVGYKSGPGWDACTGWGSIHGANLMFAISYELDGAPQITDLSASCSNGVIDITWEKGSGGIAANFELARYSGAYSSTQAPDYTIQIPAMFPINPPFTDNGADPSIAYQYRLTPLSFKGNGNPVLSNKVGPCGESGGSTGGGDGSGGDGGTENGGGGRHRIPVD